MLENVPAYSQNIEVFKQSIPADIKAAQGYEEDLNKKEAEIKALEDRYNGLIEMTPEAWQGSLREVKDEVTHGATR